MQTKILYCLTSTNQDIYMEQLLVSATSLKMHNPKSHIVLLMDQLTKDSLVGNRAKLLELVDEPIIVPTPKGFSQKEMSRYIKTTARQWVKGDFLFIDTDTVICGDLSDIDNMEGDILLCPEFHDSLNNNPMAPALIRRVKEIFHTDISKAQNYYNSGVILCKDTQQAHLFYKKWNENWLHSIEQGIKEDQPSFAKTDYDFQHAIKELDGAYHCQIFLSIKYLHRAKIIHFFNMSWFKDKQNPISPFLTKELYLNIKEKGGLDEETKAMIRNVKSLFPSVSIIVGKREFELLVNFGESLLPIMVDPDTKTKKCCKWLIKKTIRLYWILQKLTK